MYRVMLWQVLQPGDDPAEGRRIEAQRAGVAHGGVLYLVDEAGDVVSLFSEWSEAHRIDGDWPDRPVGEVDPYYETAGSPASWETGDPE